MLFAFPMSTDVVNPAVREAEMPGACLWTNSKYAGGGYGRGYPPRIPLKKKIKIRTKWWLPLHFLNLNTDLIVSKTKVKNSQNPIALVQDYC